MNAPKSVISKGTIFILVVYLYFFFGCGSTNKIRLNSIEDPLNDKCLIKIDSGINSVVLGLANFDEIERKFGKGIRSKKKFKSFTVENIFPNIEYYLSYPDYGLIFSTDPQGLFNFKRIAKELVLTSDCPCMTKNGIGIGSSHMELSQLVGEKEPTIVNSLEGVFTEVTYLSENSPVEYISFACNGEKATSDFKVEKILLRK